MPSAKATFTSCSCAGIVLQESVFMKFLDEFRLRGQGGGENSEMLNTCHLKSYFSIWVSKNAHFSVVNPNLSLLDVCGFGWHSGECQSHHLVPLIGLDCSTPGPFAKEDLSWLPFHNIISNCFLFRLDESCEIPAKWKGLWSWLPWNIYMEEKMFFRASESQEPRAQLDAN